MEDPFNLSINKKALIDVTGMDLKYAQHTFIFNANTGSANGSISTVWDTYILEKKGGAKIITLQNTSYAFAPIVGSVSSFISSTQLPTELRPSFGNLTKQIEVISSGGPLAHFNGRIDIQVNGTMSFEIKSVNATTGALGTPNFITNGGLPRISVTYPKR